jgi:phospholipid/cholesterol/gamma-HCH transport system substrate-binding protein
MADFKKSLVAVFVFGGLILFAIGLFLIGDRKRLFSGSVEVYAEWKDLGGLQNGAIVRVAGMTGGEVLSIDVPPSPDRKFRVKMRVVENLSPILRKDSIATIQTDGVVGNKVIEISGGSTRAEAIQDGGTIRSEEPFEFADLVKQASTMMQDVKKIVDETKVELGDVLDSASSVADKADQLITEATPDVKHITATSRRVADEVEVIATRVRKGEGTIGKFFRDEELYNQAKNITTDVGKTTSDVRGMIEEFRQRGVIEDVKQATTEVREMAQRANEAMSELQPEKGEGLFTDVRETLSFANETMSDFSEASEALKHNWFFRGFFNKRGFYDLDSIPVEDYRAGQMAPGYPVKRVWMSSQQLFSLQDDREVLTEDGKREIAKAMAELLPGGKTNPILIEGYASGANRTEQFVRSQERAQLVREYVIKSFHLRPNYVGIMQMGQVMPPSGGQPWEGVAFVLFQPQPPAEGAATVETDGR